MEPCFQAERTTKVFNMITRPIPDSLSLGHSTQGSFANHIESVAISIDLCCIQACDFFFLSIQKASASPSKEWLIQNTEALSIILSAVWQEQMESVLHIVVIY